MHRRLLGGRYLLGESFDIERRHQKLLQYYRSMAGFEQEVQWAQSVCGKAPARPDSAKKAADPEPPTHEKPPRLGKVHCA